MRRLLPQACFGFLLIEREDESPYQLEHFSWVRFNACRLAQFPPITFLVRHAAPPKQGLLYLPIAKVLPNRKLMKGGPLDPVLQPRCAGNFVLFGEAFWRTQCLDTTYSMFPSAHTQIGRVRTLRTEN
jgi:hypothetical protein